MRIPVPPSLWNIQTECVLIPSPVRETRMYWLSGVHDGETYSKLRPLVMAFALDPSGSAIQTFSAPLRSEMKAIFFPSGENFGWLSNDIPPTIRFASPPVSGNV